MLGVSEIPLVYFRHDTFMQPKAATSPGPITPPNPKTKGRPMAKKSKMTTGKAADREMKAMERASKNGKGTLSFTPKKAKAKKGAR